MKNSGIKVAIVTGGAQGIGKAVALRLLDERYAVAVADIDAQAGRELRATASRGSPLLFVRTDVSADLSVRRCVALVVREFGRLDALVSNAGIGGPFGTPVDKLAIGDWLRVINTNLTGCFLMARYCVPHLRASKGAMVVIASTRALMSEAHTEPYSASKGGLVALTHALAISLSHRVRVNCISPGWIETGDWKKKSAAKRPHHSAIDRLQHPCGRVGTPGDVAETAAFLLSDRAGFITGQNFVVDGGMTKKMMYAE